MTVLYICKFRQLQESSRVRVHHLAANAKTEQFQRNIAAMNHAARNRSAPDRVQLFRGDQQFLGDLGDLAALGPGVGAQGFKGLIAVQSVP